MECRQCIYALDTFRQRGKWTSRKIRRERERERKSNVFNGNNSMFSIFHLSEIKLLSPCSIYIFRNLLRTPRSFIRSKCLQFIRLPCKNNSHRNTVTWRTFIFLILSNGGPHYECGQILHRINRHWNNWTAIRNIHKLIPYKLSQRDKETNRLDKACFLWCVHNKCSAITIEEQRGKKIENRSALTHRKWIYGLTVLRAFNYFPTQH